MCSNTAGSTTAVAVVRVCPAAAWQAAAIHLPLLLVLQQVVQATELAAAGRQVLQQQRVVCHRCRGIMQGRHTCSQQQQRQAVSSSKGSR
jgi:hypothetical protein